MKWWHWLILELLIIFGVISWIYFFPGEIEDDFAKSLIGFVLIYAVDKYRETDWRNKMSENYTVEQNAGENQIEGGVVRISGSVDKLEDECNPKICEKCFAQNCIGCYKNDMFKAKPESSLRQFKNCKELIEYWYDFTGVINCSPKLFMPTIWVKHKRYGTENLIIAFDNDNESIGGSCVFIQDMWVDMQELFDNFTFLDGSPVGKEE